MKLPLLLLLTLLSCMSVLGQRHHVDFKFPEWSMPQSGQQGGYPAYRFRRLSSEPAICTPGDVYFNIGSAKNRQCLTTNTWSDFGSGSGTGTVTGTGTANALAKWTSSTVVGNSRITDNGTDIAANSGAGIFQAGDTSLGANGSFLKIDDTNKTINISADDNNTGSSLALTGGAAPSVQITQGNGIGTVFLTGDTQAFGSIGASVVFDQSATSATFEVSVIQPAITGSTDLGSTTLGYKQLFLDATITSGGTTGNQTINKAAFTVNFAATATSLTVTSNKVTTSSIVICTVQTNDTTLKSVQAVPGSGSVVLFGNAAATAETKVGCWVLNQ